MKHPHYFKPVAGLTHVDVYRVLALFAVTDPCLQHAIKKLLVAGGRGAGKDISQDVQEAIDSLARWQEMRREESTLKSADADTPLPYCECTSNCKGPAFGVSCRRFLKRADDARGIDA